uniref:Melatonin receptor 1B n=1 Tax=Terrapene triunguis TaxID=2587831 RepID=A0A674INV1_9SAUR
MLENGSLRNCCELGGRGGFGLAGRAAARRPAWVVPALSSVLIFTTVVDIVGNLLVVISVFKNRKLRNSGERGASGLDGAASGHVQSNPWTPA